MVMPPTEGCPHCYEKPINIIQWNSSDHTGGVIWKLDDHALKEGPA